MKVQNLISDLQGLQGSVKQALQQMWTQLCLVVNGNISFGSSQAGPDNINGTWVSVTTPSTANTDFTLTHNLGRIPSGWILVNISSGAILYKGGATWTTTTITLRCNSTSVNIVVFII